MSENKVDIQRRKLTKAAWATPIVSAITLPAHAQTSATTAAPTTTISALCSVASLTGTASPNSGTLSVGDSITITGSYEIADANDGLDLDISAVIPDSDVSFLAFESLTNQPVSGSFMLTGRVLVPTSVTQITNVTSIELRITVRASSIFDCFDNATTTILVNLMVEPLPTVSPVPTIAPPPPIPTVPPVPTLPPLPTIAPIP